MARNKQIGAIFYNADGDAEIDQNNDNFSAVMLYDVDNDIVNKPQKGEIVFFKGSDTTTDETDNEGKTKSQFYMWGTKAGGQNSNNEHITKSASAGTMIGAVATGDVDDDGYIELAELDESGTTATNYVYGKHWIPIKQKKGEGSLNDGSNFYVLRYADDLTKPFLKVTKVSRNLTNKALNVVSLGMYGVIKKGTALGTKLLTELNRIVNKTARDAYKEYKKVKEQYDADVDRVAEINKELSTLDVNVLSQVSNPNSDIQKDTYFSKQLLDFTTTAVDEIGKNYAYGVRLKAYLDSKCKTSPYVNDTYSNIIENLFGVALSNRNTNDSWSASSLATEIIKSNNFGFTQAIWNGRPMNSDNLRAIAVAYALQNLGIAGYETLKSANYDEHLFYETQTKVCSYAYFYLYLMLLKTYVQDTSAVTDGNNWIVKNFVNVLYSNGMNIQMAQKIPTFDAGKTAKDFYEIIMFGYKWVNNLSTKDDYLVYNFDITYTKIDSLYNEGTAINKEIPTLLKKILDYQKKYKFTAWAENTLQNMKAPTLFGKSTDSSAKQTAIKRARKLKSELLNDIMPKMYEYEVEQDKLEVDMNEINDDLDMYNKIFNDNTRSDEERQNASDKLDELTDKLDAKDALLQQSLEDAEKYDTEKVQPKETEFTTLADMFSWIGNIYAKYKRKDARQEFRTKKKEMKQYLKDKYGKGWRKEGNWKAYKFEIKVDKTMVMNEYANVFSKLAHGVMAGFLLPARNIIQVSLMLNIGGISTQLEKMKLVAESDQQTQEAINCRNAYLVLLQRWYALGGSKKAIEKTIEKHGTAKAVEGENEDDDITDILEQQGYSVESIAEQSAEMYEAQGYGSKHYYNAVITSYITTIVTAVKGFFAWCATIWKSVSAFLSVVWGVIKAIPAVKSIFGGSDTGDSETLGNIGVGSTDTSINDDCAFQIGMFENNKSVIEEKIGRTITDAEEEKIIDYITDDNYTWLNAVNQVLGTNLSLDTDSDGNMVIKDENNKKIAIAIGVGVGVIAVAGILWAVLSK